MCPELQLLILNAAVAASSEILWIPCSLRVDVGSRLALDLYLPWTLTCRMCNELQLLIMNAADARTASSEILEMHGIPHDRSADLRPDPETKAAEPKSKTKTKVEP